MSAETVPKGYKRTEVGVIPEEWEVKPLGKITTLQRGFDLPHRLRKPGNIPIVTSSGIEEMHSEARANAPGVVTGRYGTIGLVFYVDTDYWPLNTTLYVRDFHGNDPLYASFLLRTIDFHTHSGKSGVPGVNRNDLHEISLAIPHVPEQQVIAAALSDADALIEALESLLAKKRQIKQGAMQELLTGKRRLPGFTGKWETKRFDEVGTWKGGMTPSMSNPEYWDGGTIPWISSGDVKRKRLTATNLQITEAAIRQKSSVQVPAQSIVLVMRSGILRNYLPVSMNMVPMAVNQDIKVLVPDAHQCSEFLLHQLEYCGPEILNRCLKSGTTVESIEFKWLKAFEIPLPMFPEQSAIASVLSDMDAELEALEAKLDKARQVKQGMMQQLLTGKVRLI